MLLTHHTPAPPTPALLLPPAFEAFYALQHAPYLAYAHAHLPTEQATTVVKKPSAPSPPTGANSSAPPTPPPTLGTTSPTKSAGTQHLYP